MAINDISLTAGMRANLTSLQQTVSLLNRTQQRLSTGKAVNSALDNPVNFFAAQSLNNRASDLAGFKDGMSNAVQTIKAANEGLTGITTLLNAAKAVAASVEGTPDYSGKTTATITISGLKALDAVTIDGKTYTEGTDFTKGATDDLTAMSLAAAITGGTKGATALSVNGNSITIGDSTGTNDVNALDVTPAAYLSAVTVAASSERGALIKQYDDILNSITDMAKDSSFQGINLLKAGTVLSVNFGGGNKLDISGAATDAAALGLSQLVAGTDWTTGSGSIQMGLVDTALATLRGTSSGLSNNLSIIQARQDFSTNLGNVLTTGADNLTLADTNQEGANMLMLQTRNSLGTTALSLSSQAAQSVLRLFG
jgi:flagellin